MLIKQLIISGALYSVSCIGLLQAQTKVGQNMPNIIFILADDLGWTDLGCYGSKFYETPNIDRLAAEGIRFTSAYTACPVSSPTRVSYQTGKYPARLGITDYLMGRYSNQKHKKEMDRTCPVLPPDLVTNLPLTEKTIGAAFQERGYKTIHIGKWHCAQDSICFPHHHGYDINIGGCSKGAPGKVGYFSPYNNPYLSDGPKGEYLTDRLTSECIKLIREHKDKPFFINLHYYQVHLPLMAKASKIEYFERKKRLLELDTVKTFNQEISWSNKVPFKVNIAQRLIHSHPVYAAMISDMDENIGRLISELKENNLYDNTVLVFYSDNGGLSIGAHAPTSTLPLNGGKGYLYEGGIRVPLIVKWKDKVCPHSVTDQYISTVDFYPTLLDIAGLPLQPEQHVDGVSFLPALQGDVTFDRGAVFWHYPHYHNQGGRPSAAIRSGDYKLIRYYDNEEFELFNIKTDIGEKENLDMKEPDKKEQLNRLLTDWLKKTNSKMPYKNPNMVIPTEL